MRLLISARDPGAAFHLIEIARYARAMPGIEVFPVAASPALDIFQRAGLPVRPFVSGTTAIPPASEERDAILREAAAVMAEASPDAILVGLSSPDCGVDEALLARAKGVPTYALQDYWGDVNSGFGVLADTYFVIDQTAAAITRRRAGAKPQIVVCGSPRHASQGQTWRSVLASAQGRQPAAAPSIVFLGQPLWHLEGYARTLVKTAAALPAISSAAQFRYRPHPKESESERARAVHVLSAAGSVPTLDDEPLVEKSLLAADLCCTCFSSCALDFAFLNRASSAPLGGMLLMLFEPDVRQYYLDFTGLHDVPLTPMGLATTVWLEADVPAAMAAALEEEERMKCWRAAGAVLMDPTVASARVLGTILGGRSEYI